MSEYQHRLLDQCLAILGQLVSFPTVSETPNRALLDYLEEQLVQVGATVTTQMGPDGRGNLLARIGPIASGGVLLSGHTDVVPPGQGWSSEPWTLTTVGNRAVARGTADMKGFLASTIVALAQLDPDDLRAPVYLAGSYDEEIGCVGVQELLPQLSEDPLFKPELVVVGEPTMMEPRHAHLGKRVISVEVEVDEGHSSLAGAQPNAISVVASLVRSLDELQTQASESGSEFSVNCGTVSGGSQPNIIAGSCRLVFEIRFGKSQDPDHLLEPFHLALKAERQALSPTGGTITLKNLASYPAMATDIDSEAMAAVIRMADAGPSKSVRYGTEGGLFAQALAVPVVICGPGDIAVAHRPDEYVELSQLQRCIHFVSATIGRFCIDS